MAKVEMTLNKAALSLLANEVGAVTFVRHGDHRLLRVETENEPSFTPLAVAPLSRKNATSVRFRLDDTVAKQLDLAKGKFALRPFDMGRHTVSARWARKYPRKGWVEIAQHVNGSDKAAAQKPVDLPVLAVL